PRYSFVFASPASISACEKSVHLSFHRLSPRIDANSGLWESVYSQWSASRSFIALRRVSRSAGAAAVSVTPAAMRKAVTVEALRMRMRPPEMSSYGSGRGRFDRRGQARNAARALLFLAALGLRLALALDVRSLRALVGLDVLELSGAVPHGVELLARRAAVCGSSGRHRHLLSAALSPNARGPRADRGGTHRAAR